MRIIDIIEMILLVLLIFTLIFNIIYIKTKGATCLKNPVIYGMESLSNYFNEDIECICNDGISINRTAIIKEYNNPYIQGPANPFKEK